METATGVEPPAPKTRVEWGAVFIGAVIATAIGLILLTFGAALGLTVTSPYEGEGLSPVAFAIAAGLYFLWVQVMCFYIGGYVTGRLRNREPGASEHEVDVRDGLHGIGTWAVGVIAAAVIAFAGVGGVGAAASAPDTELSASVERVVQEQVDEATAEEDEAPSSATLSERRAEVARKLTVISAFVTAASFLVGAAAAFYGAHSGGNHRDKQVNWPFFTSYVRTVRVTPKDSTRT